MLRHKPSLKEFLAEADDEDIVSGLRKLIYILKTSWASDFTSVKKEQKSLWRKLSPAQHQRLKTTFTGVVNKLFTNADAKVDLDNITVQDKNEAAFVASTFLALSSSLAEINAHFADQLVRDGIITKDEGIMMKDHFNSKSGPVHIPDSKMVSAFLSQHSNLLKQLITVYDDEISFDISKVVNNLKKAIDQTPESERKRAALGIHYFLLNIAHDLFDAYKMAGKKFAHAPDPITAEK